jgi:cytochrome P450
MVPHSYLLGHILVTGKIMAKLPMDMFPVCVATYVLQEYPQLEKYGFVFLDAWPFVPPMIYVFDPEMSSQFTQLQSLPKAHMVKSEFRPLTQNKDLVTLDGAEWKLWRSIFNPGFSAKNLMSMTPAFLEEISLFVDRLRAAAKSGEIVKIEEPTIDLTIDIIGRAILYVASLL